NLIKLYSIELGKIPQAKQKEYLKSPLLKDYAYLLEKAFLEGRYNLTEKEEQLASLLAQPGKHMWTESQQKLLSSQTVKLKGRELPIHEAVGLISTLPKRERRDLHKAVVDRIKSVSSFAEAEINALFTF